MFVAGLASMKTPSWLPHDAAFADPPHADFEIPGSILRDHQAMGVVLADGGFEVLALGGRV